MTYDLFADLKLKAWFVSEDLVDILINLVHSTFKENDYVDAIKLTLKTKKISR